MSGGICVQGRPGHINATQILVQYVQGACQHGYFIVDMLISTQATQLMLQSIVGDFILLYRVYVVYRRCILVVLPPLVLWIAGIGVTIKCLLLQSVTMKNSYNPWYTAFWVLTVFFTVISTCT